MILRKLSLLVLFFSFFNQAFAVGTQVSDSSVPVVLSQESVQEVADQLHSKMQPGWSSCVTFKKVLIIGLVGGSLWYLNSIFASPNYVQKAQNEITNACQASNAQVCQIVSQKVQEFRKEAENQRKALDDAEKNVSQFTGVLADNFAKNKSNIDALKKWQDKFKKNSSNMFLGTQGIMNGINNQATHLNKAASVFDRFVQTSSSQKKANIEKLSDLSNSTNENSNKIKELEKKEHKKLLGVINYQAR